MLVKNTGIRKAIPSISLPSEEMFVCALCKGFCTNKQVIGNVCWNCIREVPIHIPDEQIKRYLKVKEYEMGETKR